MDVGPHVPPDPAIPTSHMTSAALPPWSLSRRSPAPLSAVCTAPPATLAPPQLEIQETAHATNPAAAPLAATPKSKIQDIGAVTRSESLAGRVSRMVRDGDFLNFRLLGGSSVVTPQNGPPSHFLNFRHSRVWFPVPLHGDSRAPVLNFRWQTRGE